MLGGLERALLAILLLVLMAGMGATLDGADFRAVLRRPKGLLVGVVSQFGWMPLLAFLLAKGLGLDADLALGLLIVGCCPGGTTSNLFTYYARADLALSIAMTVASTFLAVAVMPLELHLYGAAVAEGVEIPLGSIITTLVLVLLPVALGMWLKRQRPLAAARLERIGGYCGIGVLLLLIVASVVRNSQQFAEVPVQGYWAAGLLGCAGLALGQLGARLSGLSKAAQRAVGFETGIQNSPLAFAIILASFAEPAASRMLWLPMLYALLVLVSGTVLTLVLRRSQ